MNLGNYLAQLEGPAGAPTALYLIGHSLGCRVVLEILRAMSGTPRYGVFVAGCSLMAAAVPEEVARTAWPLLQGIGQPRRACVLFSTHDLVLHYAFPVGETAAGEDVLPTAVGRYGEPHDLWDWRRDCAPDGHGAYWADGRAATEAVRLVNGAVPAGAEARQTARRSLPQTTVVASRGLQERRLAPERELQTA